MGAAVGRRPWLAGRLFRRLGTLHAQLHRVAHDGLPDHGALAERRLGLARRWAAEHDDQAVAAGLDRVAPLVQRVSRVEADDVAVCHGDFHPLNVMVDDQAVTVLDWADAAVSDRHGDVARLLGLLAAVPVAAPSAPARFGLARAIPWARRAYLSAYAADAGALDPHRLEAWEPIHLLHDWARTLYTLADPARAHRVNPALPDWIRERFDAVIRRAEAWSSRNVG
jgi:aminoglycoside phosphotransferase (APT) family kinase protein